MLGRRLSEPVPADRAREVVAEELGQLVAGMDRVSSRLWARPLSERHRATLGLVLLKGRALELVYGVSCSWVPHPTATGFTWQRTLRQTRPSLWVDALTTGAPTSLTMDSLAGERRLRRDARRAVRQVAPHAFDWWEACATPEGVLREACRQAAGQYVVAFPRPGFVAAFTLAGLGRVAEAEAELSRAHVVHPPERLAEATVLLRDVSGCLVA